MFIIHGPIVDQVEATQKARLGQVGYDPGTKSWYEYVKLVGADPSVKGQNAFVGSANEGEVTMTDAARIGLKPRGMFMAALTTGQFGWILREGPTDIHVTDTTITEGDYVVDNAAYVADVMAAGEEHLVYGLARADDVAAVGSFYLNYR